MNCILNENNTKYWKSGYIMLRTHESTQETLRTVCAYKVESNNFLSVVNLVNPDLGQL